MGDSLGASGAALGPKPLERVLGEGEAKHNPGCLNGDPNTHLAATNQPLSERDRHLGDNAADLHRSVGHLDLKAVATRDRGALRQVLQKRRVPGSIATRRILHRNAQDDLGVDAAELREEISEPAPPLGAAASHPAGANDQVRRPQQDGRDQRGQLSGIMRKVRIHLHDDRRLVRQADAKSFQVCGPNATLMAS